MALFGKKKNKETDKTIKPEIQPPQIPSIKPPEMPKPPEIPKTAPPPEMPKPPEMPEPPKTNEIPQAPVKLPDISKPIKEEALPKPPEIPKIEVPKTEEVKEEQKDFKLPIETETPEMPVKPIPEIKPIKPEVYVKLEKYRQVVDNITKLRKSLQELEDKITELKKIEGDEKEKIISSESIVERMNNMLLFLDETFSSAEI